MIRVVLADDHHLVRQGISALLEKAGDIEIIGQADNGLEALELVRKLAPRVLVTDIMMSGLNGVELVKRVGALGNLTQVVVLSMHADENLVRQTLRNGARGYLLKRSVSEELLLAVRAAARGETFLSPQISQHALTDLMAAPQAVSPFSQLSEREIEVLQLVAEGNTNKEIAAKLRVSDKTVEKHRASLMQKLSIHDTAGLVRFAIKNRLISLEE